MKTARGFTLIEIIVAMAIMVLLMLLIAQIVSDTSAISVLTRKRMDAESQARLVLDRMAQDFACMIKRPDVDCLFAKRTGNDALFFYSEAPGYYVAGTAASAQNSASLVGYRVNPNPVNGISYQLERMSKGLTWDSAGGNAPAMPFLAFDASGQEVLGTTIAQAWNMAGNSLGTLASDFTDGTDTDYQSLADQVVRLEICFLLTDGTSSDKPICSATPSTWASGTFYTSSEAMPSASDDVTQGYMVGSRWFNPHTQQGFICTANPAGAATWNALGAQDLAGIVVAIAVVDTTTRKLLTTAQLTQIAQALPDSNLPLPLTAPPTAPPTLMATTWGKLVQTSSFAKSAGIPAAVAAHVRVYQRTFYLGGN